MDTQELPHAETPSKAAIGTATIMALAVALLLLFTIVLPAEYGRDPLKTGKLLGLTGISQAEPEAPKGAAPTPVAGQAGVFVAQPHTYKVDGEDFQLRPGEGVEMKYHMQKGAALVYSWKANGNLAFEFHGEPDVKPTKDYFESYELNKIGKQFSYGSFTAPSTGIHGWFFQNKTKNEITFRLNVAGFFDSAKMFAGGTADDVPVEDVK